MEISQLKSAPSARVDLGPAATAIAEAMRHDTELAALVLSRVVRAPRELVSMSTASVMLDVSRSTLYRLIAAGELKRVHIDRSARITADSIAAYVARLIAQSEAEEVA